MTPNGSTASGLAGGYAATILIQIIQQYHWLTVTPDMATAITGLCILLAAYAHPDGRVSTAKVTNG